MSEIGPVDVNLSIVNLITKTSHVMYQKEGIW